MRVFTDYAGSLEGKRDIHKASNVWYMMIVRIVGNIFSNEFIWKEFHYVWNADYIRDIGNGLLEVLFLQTLDMHDHSKEFGIC